MNDRTEYWWVHHDSEVQPAEVGFVGGIPVHFRFIGTEGRVRAEAAELIERLPAPPVPIFKPQAAPAAQPAKPQKSGSWLWFFGILLLILVVQCSGPLFDAIK
ncbi:hypothetical protein [Microvirga guangxiensis]|uniref:Uncharacterized protein n=1 Tax=Microvirga guangxiensis TaxID=549386 RepID=A0A1G5BUE0_9HYPH|nr:hypothetical protein [Microvirga guangxiensis]SCX93761.1 hypothetical protein SAMN02927923_00348 [Microvirga guangxiensis]